MYVSTEKRLYNNVLNQHTLSQDVVFDNFYINYSTSPLCCLQGMGKKKIRQKQKVVYLKLTIFICQQYIMGGEIPRWANKGVLLLQFVQSLMEIHSSSSSSSLYLLSESIFHNNYLFTNTNISSSWRQKFSVT